MRITHRLLSHHLRLLLRRLLKTFLKSKIKEHSSLTAQVGLGVLEAMAETEMTGTTTKCSPKAV
jgi:hypothetical protein